MKNAPKNGSERPTYPFWSQMAPKTRKGIPKKSQGALIGPPFGRPKPIKIDEKSSNIFNTFFGRPFERLWHRFGSILPAFSLSFWIPFPKQRFYEKRASRLYETTIFKVRRPQKSIKNQQKIVTESRTRLLSHFDQNRPSLGPPIWSPLATKALSKTCPKIDLEKNPENLFLALLSRTPPYRLNL